MFNLDANAARAADNKSAFIDEAGKYIGTFTRAEYMDKPQTGSTGLGLTFKSREGAEAQFYVNLSYQHGQRNKGGHELVNAIMACLQLRHVGDPQAIRKEGADCPWGQPWVVLPVLIERRRLVQREIQRLLPRPIEAASLPRRAHSGERRVRKRRHDDPVPGGMPVLVELQLDHPAAPPARDSR